jgi:hypothetical protein
MRYLRTKDGRILDFKRLFLLMTGRPYAGESVGFLTDVPIVKRSDDVEKLFDGIFEFRPGEMRPVCEIHRREEDGKLYRYWSRSGCAEPAKDSVIRGGIWTERGLIYAAEMDRKGGWKLL